MPRGIYERRKEVDSRDTPDIERPIDIESILVNGAPTIEVATEEALKTIDDDKFMNEMVEIHLHEPNTEQEPSHAFLGWQGETLWLQRGMSYTLKRGFICVLALSKNGRVSQTRQIAPDGSQSYIEKEVLSTTYPFSVIADPNPKGGPWLRNLLKSV